MEEEKRIAPEESTEDVVQTGDQPPEATEPTDAAPAVVESEPVEEPVPEIEYLHDESDETEVDDGNDRRSALQQRVGAIPEKRWDFLQIVFGGLLGLAVSLCLFGSNSGDGSAQSFTLYAAILALLVPRLIERSVDRKAPKARIAMAGMLALCMIVYVIQHFVLGRA